MGAKFCGSTPPLTPRNLSVCARTLNRSGGDP
jgi:hypothetical protein